MQTTYYITKTAQGLLELRQTRFKEQYCSGKEHPHDVCAIARSIDEMRDMVQKYLSDTVDWTLPED